MYRSFTKKKPRAWVHDALSLKSQGILRLHILWLLRLQITFHVRPVALFTLVQCPVRWCSMVLTMSRKRYRFEHSLRSYLWYRTSTVEFEKAEAQAFLTLSARSCRPLAAKLESSSLLNAFSHILWFH